MQVKSNKKFRRMQRTFSSSLFKTFFVKPIHVKEKTQQTAWKLPSGKVINFSYISDNFSYLCKRQKKSRNSRSFEEKKSVKNESFVVQLLLQ